MQVSSYLPTLLTPLRASELHMRSGQNGEKPWETSDLGKRQVHRLQSIAYQKEET